MTDRKARTRRKPGEGGGAHRGGLRGRGAQAGRGHPGRGHQDLPGRRCADPVGTRCASCRREPGPGRGTQGRRMLGSAPCRGTSSGSCRPTRCVPWSVTRISCSPSIVPGLSRLCRRRPFGPGVRWDVSSRSRSTPDAGGAGGARRCGAGRNRRVGRPPRGGAGAAARWADDRRAAHRGVRRTATGGVRAVDGFVDRPAPSPSGCEHGLRRDECGPRGGRGGRSDTCARRHCGTRSPSQARVTSPRSRTTAENMVIPSRGGRNDLVDRGHLGSRQSIHHRAEDSEHGRRDAQDGGLPRPRGGRWVRRQGIRPR